MGSNLATPQKEQTVTLKSSTICPKNRSNNCKIRGQILNKIFQILIDITNLEEFFVDELVLEKHLAPFLEIYLQVSRICIQRTCPKQEIRIPKKWGVKAP